MYDKIHYNKKNNNNKKIKKINSEKRQNKQTNKKTCEVLSHSDFENLAGPSGDLSSTECMASDNNIYSNMFLED